MMKPFFLYRLNDIAFIFALLFVAAAIGCNQQSNNIDMETYEADDTETETETETATATSGVIPTWTTELITDTSAGIQADLVLGPNGQIGLAYFSNDNYEDGICDEIATNPPMRLRQPFYYASKTIGPGTWLIEQVDSPVVAFSATGLSLAYSPLGEPSIAFTGGIPEGQYCGANDAVLATRSEGTWQFETAAALSGDSQTGISGSDEGMVVGLWSALKYSASGEPAIVHKDVHFGALQSIDLRKTDAEFAWRRGGTWIHEAIDANEGAGDYNELLFDGDTPIAIYSIPVETMQDSRQGVWAARRADDGTWEDRVQLHSGGIYQEITAGFNPISNELVVAFYSASDNAVRVRRLSDLSLFTDSAAWESEIVGSAVYDEGRYVSLAFTPQGKEVLAYHRCKMNSSSFDSCDQNDEAGVLAIRTNSGWTYETIAEAFLGSCGEYTDVVVDATGVAHIVYRCTEKEGDQFTFRLFVASKKIEAP